MLLCIWGSWRLIRHDKTWQDMPVDCAIVLDKWNMENASCELMIKGAWLISHHHLPWLIQCGHVAGLSLSFFFCSDSESTFLLATHPCKPKPKGLIQTSPILKHTQTLQQDNQVEVSLLKWWGNIWKHVDLCCKVVAPMKLWQRASTPSKCPFTWATQKTEPHETEANGMNANVTRAQH